MKTWAMRSDHYTRMARVETRMVRWMCGASASDRQPSRELRRVGIEETGAVMGSRLKRHTHLEGRDSVDWVKGWWLRT